MNDEIKSNQGDDSIRLNLLKANGVSPLEYAVEILKRRDANDPTLDPTLIPWAEQLMGVGVGFETGEVEIISAEALAAEPIEEESFVLDPYIPDASVTILYGKPGVGKTSFVWTLADAMKNDEEFLGCQTVQGDVLFISLDMSKKLVQRRINLTGFKPQGISDRFHGTYPANINEGTHPISMKGPTRYQVVPGVF